MSLSTAKHAAQNRAMDARSSIEPSQQAGRFRRIGFLVFPDCQILDVCGPLEAFFFADHWLNSLGKTEVPGYQTHHNC